MTTDRRGGRPLEKTVSVITNDPKNPQQKLKIKGTIHQFAQIRPRYIRLDGNEGESISKTVTIKGNDLYPFKITKVVPKHGLNISYTLTPPDKENKNTYLLTVNNTKKDAGRYSDTLYLHTDNEIKKELRVNLVGSIKKIIPPTPVPPEPAAPEAATPSAKPPAPETPETKPKAPKTSDPNTPKPVTPDEPKTNS